jgi:hypothetical protein
MRNKRTLASRVDRFFRRGRRRPWLAVAGGAIVGALVVILVVLPVWLEPPGVTPFVPGTLEIQAISGELNSSFFGVDVHAVANGSLSLPVQVGGTPFVSFRFSPQGEATDQIHSITYNGSGVGSPVYEESDAAFIAGCRQVACEATMMVPAEIDNPAEAAATVRYVEQNLSFRPEYWAIGNEPQQWTHWGIPWTSWRVSDHATPNAMQFALEVQQYISAIRAVDPTARFIGLESVAGGTIDPAWFRDVVEVNGPNLSAVAYHAYPGGNATVTGNLSNFDSGLTNPTGFPLNYPATVSLVRSACSSCRISIFVDEFNAALGGNFKGLMTSYSEVPFVAAALVEAIREGVPRVLFFDLEDLDGQMPFGLLTLGAPPRPAFLLYSGILDHVVDGAVANATPEGGPLGIFSVLSHNGSQTSLLVVNLNLTYGLTLSLPHGVNELVGPALPYAWSPGSPGPQEGPPVGDPLNMDWMIPPQGVLLLNWGS